jgi:hypothetical protein
MYNFWTKRRKNMELVFSDERNGKALAAFCRRVTFDDAYRRADGETEEERKAMAHRIMAAFSDVRACLEERGA